MCCYMFSFLSVETDNLSKWHHLCFCFFWVMLTIVDTYQWKSMHIWSAECKCICSICTYPIGMWYHLLWSQWVVGWLPRWCKPTLSCIHCSSVGYTHWEGHVSHYCPFDAIVSVGFGSWADSRVGAHELSSVDRVCFSLPWYSETVSWVVFANTWCHEAV